MIVRPHLAMVLTTALFAALFVGSCGRDAPHAVPAAETKMSAAARPAEAVSADRTWLAGRFDSNRVVIYFDAVKFKGELQRNSIALPAPKAELFFAPRAVTDSFIAKFREASSEHFSVGDQYDLLVGGNHVVVVTLTTLVGMETDEQVGNDSYIGALATVSNSELRPIAVDYYAVRPHSQPNAGASPFVTAPHSAVGMASVGADSGSLSDMATALRAGLMSDSTIRPGGRLPLPAISTIQRVTLANGSQRYYLQARLPDLAKCRQFGAWITEAVPYHALAIDQESCPVDGEPPQLLNAINLAGGGTGLIVKFQGGDGIALNLIEFQDGIPMTRMRSIWSISTAE